MSLRKRNGNGVLLFGVRFALVVYIMPKIAHPASESSTSSSESKDDCKQASTLCHVGLLLMVFGPAKYILIHPRSQILKVFLSFILLRGYFKITMNNFNFKKIVSPLLWIIYIARLEYRFLFQFRLQTKCTRYKFLHCRVRFRLQFEMPTKGMGSELGSESASKSVILNKPLL